MWEPEPDVVRAAQRGDAHAFEQLVHGCQPDVYRLAWHMLRDAERARDVTQDVFLDAFRGLTRFRAQSKFSTWILRIARNRCVDAMRERDRRLRAERSVRVDEPQPDTSLRAAVRAAIDALGIELREPFVLIELLGLSYPETARALGVPQGTVKSRMHRARRVLAETLRESEAADEA